MRKHIRTMFLSVAILFSLTACGSKTEEDYGNEYIPETDFPYMYETGLDGTYIAESDTGYYYISGHFLFYADKDTMESIPLCNKPDCKHMDETDYTKVGYCNAYLGRGGVFPYIQCYKNEIYTIEGFNATEKNYEKSLIKISADGSKREYLMKASGSELYAIHRGYIYIARNGGVNACVVRIPLDKLDSEPETVFKPKLDSSNFFLTLKGNYAIITNFGVINEDESYHYQCFTYNIITGETVHILEDEESAGICPAIYRSNDDRLIYSKSDTNYSEGPVTDDNIIYSADLDGTNETVFKDYRDKTDKFAVQLTFDGTYYYERWVNGMLEEEDSKGRHFTIYDKEFNLLYDGNLDWLPRDFWIAYGSDSHIFFSYHDKETDENVIDYVDKSLFEQGRFEPKRLSDRAPKPPIGW